MDVSVPEANQPVRDRYVIYFRKVLNFLRFENKIMDNNINQRLLDYIAASPGPFHAVRTTAERLEKDGFLPLDRGDEWNLQAGGKYYFTVNDSTLIAFRIPAGKPAGFIITASHCDTPVFKVKPGMECAAAGHYVQLNTERYGGLLINTWFDRPLGAAGRVLIEKDGRVETRLIAPDQDIAIIPSMAPHLNKEANNGFTPNLSVDTFPLYGMSESSGSFLSLIAAQAAAPEEAVLGYDLNLYCRERGTLIGPNREFVSSPRLDDLACAFGCLEGFLTSSASSAVSLYCLFDNEEVGSSTKQGAASTVLLNALRRITESLGYGSGEFDRLLNSSFLVSADNAHAIHPNHPEFSDKYNGPVLNKGLVIKFNSMQKYTTDGVSAALFRSICREAGAEVQNYANRSDLPGGSTLGSIATTHVPVRAVDIGLPQLAMHSCYETMGASDMEHLVNAIRTLYSHSLIAEGSSWRWVKSKR